MAGIRGHARPRRGVFARRQKAAMTASGEKPRRTSAAEDHSMFADGDRVAVGLSGGMDPSVLLAALVYALTSRTLYVTIILWKIWKLRTKGSTIPPKITKRNLSGSTNRI